MLRDADAVWRALSALDDDQALNRDVRTAIRGQEHPRFPEENIDVAVLAATQIAGKTSEPDDSRKVRKDRKGSEQIKVSHGDTATRRR